MRNPDRETTFRFKQFAVVNRLSAMKVGTDGVLLGAWAAREALPDLSARKAPPDLSAREAPPDLSAREAVSAEALPRNPRILDVGCGTGLISLMMAQRFPAAEIFAVEIDQDSANEAEANFASSPWADRLHLIRGDFAEVRIERPFDLIVSNPPFFTNGMEAPEAARRQARHESSLPLAVLLAKAQHLLAPNGLIALILPADRMPELNSILPKGVYVGRNCLVSTVPSKPPRRVMVELSTAPELNQQMGHSAPLSTAPDKLSIHDGHGDFTLDYKTLTKDFYLNF